MASLRSAFCGTSSKPCRNQSGTGISQVALLRLLTEHPQASASIGQSTAWSALAGWRYRPWLRHRFEGWSPEVFELLENTPFEEIEQRDLYDRPPQVMTPPL